jgi:hypothetical protein
MTMTSVSKMAIIARGAGKIRRIVDFLIFLVSLFIHALAALSGVKGFGWQQRDVIVGIPRERLIISGFRKLWGVQADIPARRHDHF